MRCFNAPLAESERNSSCALSGSDIVILPLLVMRASSNGRAMSISSLHLILGVVAWVWLLNWAPFSHESGVEITSWACGGPRQITNTLCVSKPENLQLQGHTIGEVAVNCLPWMRSVV